jgi:hypothetical protein
VSEVDKGRRSVVTPRMHRARANLDLQAGRGLEIGPLFSPIVYRHEADVRYVDIHSAEDLREHFAHDPNVRIEDIVDVDFVLIDGDSVRSVGGASSLDGPYTWAIASHVIEHIPDLISWLADLASVLVDDGKLSLAIPDRRYCFDYLRPATTVGDMLLAHQSRDARPSARAVFDHFQSHVEVAAVDLWRGIISENPQRTYSVDQAWGLVKDSKAGEYVDSHVWLFTPRSFVEQMNILSKIGLIEFTIANLLPTAELDFEFFVTLRRLPRNMSDGQRRVEFEQDLHLIQDQIPVELQPEVTSIAATDSASAAGDTPEVAAIPIDTQSRIPEAVMADGASLTIPSESFVVSDRERRLIVIKRRLAERVYRLMRR